ncbi:MAG: SUMF1/EgtB/PvdO family nonheme iron enzyme [Nitrospira sp.]|nr:SUMF1/EgtB/PvdO family nonheme iron enzyme [Nitrospira sp.]
MSKKDGSGEIITFYSYKGGTGRSMALANVACLLASQQTQGKGILMVDWDLEAPGLHRFFQGRFSEEVAESKNIRRPFDELPGLIDLFMTFDQQTPDGPPETDEEATERAIRCLKGVQLDDYVVHTSIPYLSLMRAGRFDPEYSTRVNTFDWENIFNRSPLLIQLFAEHLAGRYRYVLIDSRTGLTDISGICTTLMPEKLVVVFTPNRQSLTGVIDQVRRATRYRRQSDDLRPLLVFPLPSRIDISEPRRRDAWRFGDLRAGIEGYQPLFEKLFKEVYHLSQCDLSGYFDEIQVPHVPAYAYGEEIGALVERSGDALSITRSYQSLCERAINGDNPWSEPPQAASVAKIAEAKTQAAESSRAADIQAKEAHRAKRIAQVSLLVAGLLILLAGAIGAWLWKEALTVEGGILMAQSTFMSIHMTPQMETVPGGTVEQGDTHGRGRNDEQPVHKVTVKPFAMGKSEVTFDEYKRFALTAKRPVPHDEYWGRGRRPVISVSWLDAKDYADWLSKQTGKRYRLPTESEWEYAARSIAKKEDHIWAGTSEETQLPDYAVYNAAKTEPVGTKKPNALGLYDMSGNVWEWVEDCWHNSYKNAPTDGSARLGTNGGDCGRRVIRGGSWGNEPESLRASNRSRDNAGGRSNSIGFRLAQDLEP